MPGGALVEPVELAEFVHRQVPTVQARTAVRVAEGWLRAATGLAVWPDPRPEELFSWAVELAAIALENPAGLSELTVGGEHQVFALQRRAEILAAAARSLGPTVGGPLGSFPLPTPWPGTVVGQRLA